MNYTADVFKQFSTDWAIAAAGKPGDGNGMTIAWGGMGTIWNKPVVTLYVRPCRYTHDFLEREDYFTVTFYDEKYREALNIMGTKSGKDCDKAALAGLTPVAVGESIGYAEAKVTVLCRKIYTQELELSLMPADVVQRQYPDNEPHTMYIGEVVEIIEK